MSFSETKAAQELELNVKIEALKDKNKKLGPVVLGVSPSLAEMTHALIAAHQELTAPALQRAFNMFARMTALQAKHNVSSEVDPSEWQNLIQDYLQAKKSIIHFSPHSVCFLSSHLSVVVLLCVIYCLPCVFLS
jgi:hypothetical protein